MSNWIKVEDRLPEDSRQKNVLTERGLFQAQFIGIWAQEGNPNPIKVLAWQELPNIDEL